MKIAIVFVLAMGLAGCAPNPLRNVSIEADVSQQVSGDFDYSWNGKNYHGGRVGRVAVNLDQPVSREFTLRMAVEHRSLLDTGRDRGEERASAGVVWRPFSP